MKKGRLLLIGLSLITCFTVVYVFILSYRHFIVIKNSPVTAWQEDHQGDCAIALTGGPNRILDAFEQLYLKRVKKVIISGVHPYTRLQDIFPQKMYYGDINTNDIILEKRSLTTYGNAQQTLPLVEALKCKDIVLITSRTHMPRAFTTFRTHFPTDIPIYKRSTVGRRMKPHWSRLGAETLKSVFYDLWFY